MGLVGLLVASGRGDPDLYRIGAPSAAQLVGGPLLGVVVGLAFVGLTRLASRRFQWARDLHRSFRDLLGPLVGGEIVILAAASSLGEELLFRGALLPWLGLWVQAGIFALLHVGPGKRFLPWTATAFAIGVGFGVLARETGSLGGPIAAHFVINFFNLRYITSRRAAWIRARRDR